jgi:integrase
MNASAPAPGHTKQTKKPARGRSAPTLSPASSLKYVERTRNGAGRLFFYYRRGAERIPLPGPEGSPDFKDAYEAAAARFEPPPEPDGGTVGVAIDAYLASADFSQLAPASRRDYSYYLGQFKADFGHIQMMAMDSAMLDTLRDKYLSRANQWNALRARMKAVVDQYMRRHPKVLPVNPWPVCKRLKAPKGDANKPWPLPVLSKVFAGASPEFRALLTAYLLTAQRGGDVTRFTADQYDAEARILTFRQGKTDEHMTLHVPESLAEVFSVARKNRATGKRRKWAQGAEPLFFTPRGKPWTMDNAQQTLAALLRRLKLPRYTLHGLRATGPTALKQGGMDNARLRALTGHTSDKNLEVYLKRVVRAPLAKDAMTGLAVVFAPVIANSLPICQLPKPKRLITR